MVLHIVSNVSPKAAEEKMLTCKSVALCLFYVTFAFGQGCRFSRIFHGQVEEFGELWINFTKYSLGADYLQVRLIIY